MTIYLMIKTHSKTRLKYLCKTTRNPFKYKGSGVDWVEHLKNQGNQHDTEIIKECNNQSELYYWGKYYSRLWNIVEAMDDFGNKIWANRIPESGGGGTPSAETSSKISNANKGKSPWNKGVAGWKCDSETNINKSLSKQGSKNPQYNKPRTEKECDSISEGVKNTWFREVSTCPHCGVSGTQNMSRWHFDNCKLKISEINTNK